MGSVGLTMSDEVERKERPDDDIEELNQLEICGALRVFRASWQTHGRRKSRWELVEASCFCPTLLLNEFLPRDLDLDAAGKLPVLVLEVWRESHIRPYSRRVLPSSENAAERLVTLNEVHLAACFRLAWSLFSTSCKKNWFRDYVVHLLHGHDKLSSSLSCWADEQFGREQDTHQNHWLFTLSESQVMCTRKTIGLREKPPEGI
ncbi:hypothetical protein C8J56DRAFT_1019653 [Mycena floridula]|nr:hypothetical protein C8J56DRAFT_1019653 [Mycena floridula]